MPPAKLGRAQFNLENVLDATAGARGLSNVLRPMLAAEKAVETAQDAKIRRNKAEWGGLGEPLPSEVVLAVLDQMGGIEVFIGKESGEAVRSAG